LPGRLGSFEEKEISSVENMTAGFKQGKRAGWRNFKLGGANRGSMVHGKEKLCRAAQGGKALEQ